MSERKPGNSTQPDAAQQIPTREIPEGRIYLTGYRGTGKTTVGKLISQELGVECVDLDQAIETAAGTTIREIFREGGEQRFRDWETRCLRHVADPSSTARVVSLGGGAILRPENRRLIRQTGTCVYLTAAAATIAQRINADATTNERRPALTDLTPTEEIEQLLAQREPLYRETADQTFPTDHQPPQEIAAAILRWLESGRSEPPRLGS